MDREALLESQSFKQHDLDQLLDETTDENLWEKHVFEYLDSLIGSPETFTVSSEEFNGAGSECWETRSGEHYGAILEGVVSDLIDSDLV